MIGAIGRLTKQKNIKFSINVFNQIYKDIHNPFLVICGDGPQEELLKDYSTELGLNKNVR